MHYRFLMLLHHKKTLFILVQVWYFLLINFARLLDSEHDSSVPMCKTYISATGHC